MAEKLEDIELRSEEVQEILSAVPNWMIRWGSLLFLFLLLMIVALSWLIKYPDIITSQTRITTEIPPYKEYAPLTGKIDTLFIADNETVDKGEPLSIIENSARYTDVFFLKSIIDTIQISNSEFYFPIGEIPVLFLGEIDASYALFENSYIQYELNKDLQPFENEAKSNRFTISELRRRLTSMESQKEIHSSELRFREKDLDRFKKLYEKGVIATSEYEIKQLEYLQAERNYKNMDASISQLRESISQASSSLKGTQISSTREEMMLLKRVIQSYSQLKKSIEDWEMKYVFKSGINGTVSFLDFWSENQTVNKGDLVFTIIPSENSNYVAKLKTPVQNSGKIKRGQRVNIKLENYPDTEFGILQGTVDKISLIPDVEGFYRIDVKLSKELITSYNKKIDFKQEMRGIAEVVTEDLRLIERFFYQLRNVFNRN